MKKLLYSLLLLCIISNPMLNAQVERTPQGIKFNTQHTDVEVTYYSSGIVRVSKKQAALAVDKKSYSVIKTPESGLNIQYEQKGEIYRLSSGIITTEVEPQSGRITFLNNHGDILISEKPYGASLTPKQEGEKQTFEVSQSFLLSDNEAIYGLGQQQQGRMNQRGQKVYLNNGYTVVSIPYFTSTKGYGLFWDNYSPTNFIDNKQGLSFTSEVGDLIDYYVMTDSRYNADGVIAQMRDLTGQAPLFPVWSYGFWQSKERYKTQDEVVEVLQRYRDMQIPIDGMIQDWQYWGDDSPEESPRTWNAMSFDKKRFPNPQKFVDDIHKLNGHLMIVAWPGFGNETPQFKEFSRRGYMLGFNTWSPNSKAKPYDVYNPDARDLYWDYLNKGVFTYGIDGWWLDSTEPDHLNPKMPDDYDLPIYDKRTFRSVHNAYSLLHTSGIYEHQRSVTSDKRVFIMTRCAFAGQQRNGANTWSGDIAANWDNFRKQLTAGLNFSLCGIPHWNTDVGGFFLWNYQKPLESDPYKELFVRWLQFGVVCPIMRVHGTDAPKEIFRFGKEGDWAYDAYLESIKLRYRLIPYIYSTSWDVTHNNGTFMRALAMDYNLGDKPQHYDIGYEYMFGRQILAAPIVEQLYTQGVDYHNKADFSVVKNYKLYLPNDLWYDFWTGEKIEGNRYIEREAPINMLPLYVKAGSILPLGPAAQFVDMKDWKELEVRIYPGADGEFVLYEDEGDNYNYEQGAYSEIRFHWDDKARTLTIAERTGKYKGMLKSRSFNISVVSEGIASGYPASKGKKVSYSGKAKTIKL